MIDFHSHILPGIDDGSKSVEESLLMLDALNRQGVSKVVATPHFYADDESVNNFLKRRKASFDKLSESLSDTMPEIIPGAEVSYYEGIRRLENLSLLCIEGTNLLLFEMPYSKWSANIINELSDIASSGKITVVLAHIERYIDLQSQNNIYRLLESGILFQLNASCINKFFTRKRALKLLKTGEAHFIGSDCHNTTDRAPEIGKAFATAEKRLGKSFIDYFINYGNEMFL